RDRTVSVPGHQVVALLRPLIEQGGVVMNLPGFTAESSIYPSLRTYRSARPWTDPATGQVVPQALSCPNKGCGPCKPDPTSSKGGMKCCCVPAPDSPGGCAPRFVECRPGPTPPPPPPPDCGCGPFKDCCDGGK